MIHAVSHTDDSVTLLVWGWMSWNRTGILEKSEIMYYIGFCSCIRTSPKCYSDLNTRDILMNIFLNFRRPYCSNLAYECYAESGTLLKPAPPQNVHSVRALFAVGRINRS